MEPVNMAILGAGAIAGHMASAIPLCPGMRPWAVAAREKSRAERFARQYGFSRAYGSYEAMLEDKAVGLVYIAVPHALHAECARLCLEAGKHILVEKPFTANARQAEAVISLARAKGLLAAECQWMQYLPIVGPIKTLCASGAIGEIKMLSGEIGYHLTQERLFDPSMAGGALLDIGVYAVALAGIVFGYGIAGLSSSAALTGRGVDETNSFILKYKTGQMASFSTSMTYMCAGRGAIWGSEGYAEIEDINRLNAVRVYDKGRREIACYTNPEVGNAYVYVLKSVLEALQAGRADTREAPHEEILGRIKILDSLRKQWGMAYPFEVVTP